MSRLLTNRWICTLTLIASCIFVVAGCGDDSNDDSGNSAEGGGNNGGGGEVSCTVSASANPDPSSRTITGVGSAQCDGNATLAVETCVQWDSSGTFEDIQCTNQSESGVSELEVENRASCGIGAGTSFRVRVNATVDGVDQPEEISSVVSCD